LDFRGTVIIPAAGIGLTGISPELRQSKTAQERTPMRISSRILWTAMAGVAAVVIATAGMAAVSAQAPAGAPPQHGFGTGRGGPGPLSMLQQLNLTDAQREQIRSIMDERRPDQATGRKMGDLQHQLTVAIFADTPDTAQIEQLKASIAEAEAAALAGRVDTELRIAQVLTPDQRQKARDLPPPGPGRGRGRM
jgi:periplasmic protein CpxP/Spy